MRRKPPGWQKAQQKAKVNAVVIVAKQINCIMPASCCVVGCVTRCGPSSKAQGVSLFRIPVNKRQRRAWISTIARKNWAPKSWERVCSKHFVSGWPSDDPDDIDFRPTVLMKGPDFEKTPSVNSCRRNHRANKRAERSHLREMAEVMYLIKYNLNDI